MSAALKGLAVLTLGAAVVVGCDRKDAPTTTDRSSTVTTVDNNGTVRTDRARPAQTGITAENRVTNPREPESTRADNTRMNTRDRSGANATPMDQGEGSTDLTITQNLRKSVMADSSLSSTAKNCKIITKDQKVVLRGPVDSQSEKDAIEAKARSIDAVREVENDLEVKP